MPVKFEDLVTAIQKASGPFGMESMSWVTVQEATKDLLDRLRTLEAAANQKPDANG